MIKFYNPLGKVCMTSDYFAGLVGAAAQSCYGVCGMATGGTSDSLKTIVLGTNYPDKVTSFSGLVSSDLAKKMQRKEDKIINGKSQLGVLKGYLNAAVGIGIINIVVSCISLILKDKMIEIVNKNTVYYIVSAIGISTLAANLFLMFLLFRFMVNRQLWDK